MKFKTTDLVTRIDNLLSVHEAEEAAKAAEAEDKEYLQRVDWLNTYTAGFKDFADLIHEKLDKNEPITAEDLPRTIKGSYNYSLQLYSGASGWRRDNTRYESLKKLKAALQASQEDTVSPTAIKQLGFQDVTFLFAPEAAK